MYRLLPVLFVFFCSCSGEPRSICERTLNGTLFVGYGGTLRRTEFPSGTQEPITLSELHDTSFDLIVTLTPEAHHQALELTRTMAVDVEYWPTYDPSLATGSRDQILEAYRTCRDQLLQRIKTRFILTGMPSF